MIAHIGGNMATGLALYIVGYVDQGAGTGIFLGFWGQCLGMSCFFLARSDEVFANGSGVVNPAHCLARSDVAFFFSGDRQLRRLHWSDADRVEVRLRGRKGDQAQVGSVIVRTRGEVRGLCSQLGEGGGAVALMVALLSCLQLYLNTLHFPRTFQGGK